MTVLATGPFDDWRLPGLLLGGLVGGGFLAAGSAEQVGLAFHRPLSVVSGVGLVAFELVEWRWLGPHPLQVLLTGLGAAVAVLSLTSAPAVDGSALT